MFLILIAGIVFIGIKIYDFFVYLKNLIFNFIESSLIFLIHHLLEISTILSLVFALLFMYRVLNKRRVLIKNKLFSFLEKSKLKFIAVNNKFQPLIKPIKDLNEKHKPKDIKAVRKYGIISFLVGLFGAIIFYSSGLCYIALFYCYYLIAGIFDILFPQKAL